MRWFFAVVISLALVQAGAARAQVWGADFTMGEGEPVVASGDIAPGDVVLSLPLRAVATGTLQNDVRRLGLVNSPFVLPAGTRVYRVLLARTDGYQYEAWCGVRPAARPGDPDVGACVGRPSPQNRGFMAQRWVGVDMSREGTPYYPGSFGNVAWSVLRESQPTPVIEHNNEPLPVALTQEIVFSRWTDQGAVFDVRVSDGSRVTQCPPLTIRAMSDGTVLLRTPSGVLRLTRADPDSSGALVESAAP